MADNVSPSLSAHRPRSLDELRRETVVRPDELYGRQIDLIKARLSEPDNERPLCVALRAIYSEICSLSQRLRQIDAELKARRAA